MDAPRAAGDRRRWWALLAAGAALAVAAAAIVPRLRIDTDLLSLFPDAPAARDYRDFVATFGGFERVYVLVTSDDPGEDRAGRLAEAATDLAERLAASPLLRTARAGPTGADERFFLEGVLPRAALLLDDDALARAARDLEAVPAERRVREVRATLSGPLGPWAARVFAADPLGLAAGLDDLVPKEGEIPIDPEHEAFLSPDGGTALVVAEPAVSELDTDYGALLERELDATFEALRADHGDDLRLAALGGPLYAVRDARDIRADVARTVTGSAIGIALLLALHFRGVRVPLVLLAAVLVGVLWTAGGTAAIAGRVSVLSLAFAAIVVGLGVDYGIHGAHAYLDERADGRTRFDAMRATLRRTGRSILASAATTACVFALLRTSTFVPVRELGTLVASGIAAILVATVAVGAAALVLTDRDRAAGPPAAARGEGPVAAVVTWARRRRVAVRIALVAVTLPAIWGATRVGFDVDLRAFRPTHRMEHAAEEKLATMFSVGLDPAHVVVRDVDEAAALARARRLATALRARLGDAATVRSPSDYLVAGRWTPERAEPLREAIPASRVAALERALADEGFRPEPFEEALRVLRALAAGTPPPPIPEALRPDWVRQSVRVDAGGAAVALTVAASAADLPATSLAATVAGIDPGARVASIGRVADELRRTITTEFLHLVEWCLAAIVAIVALTFRGNPRRTLLALLPVALGGTWLLGICGAFGIRLDFFTITAAPLLLGIGIDDGLHAIHGVEAHGGLVASLRRVGGAIAITTWTTCVGFGSLALSHLPALRQGGPLIALGTALCLVATVVVLPAFSRADGPPP